jgi:hypothetical protein
MTSDEEREAMAREVYPDYNRHGLHGLPASLLDAAVRYKSELASAHRQTAVVQDNLARALDDLGAAAARAEQAERDVATLGCAFKLLLLGETTIHGLSEKGTREVVTAFKAVFPTGFDDARLTEQPRGPGRLR